MEWWRDATRWKDDRNGERKMLKSGSETIWMLYYCVTGGGYRLYGGDKGRLGQTSRAPGNWKVMNIAVDGFPRRTLIVVGSFYWSLGEGILILWPSGIVLYQVGVKLCQVVGEIIKVCVWKGHLGFNKGYTLLIFFKEASFFVFFVGSARHWKTNCSPLIQTTFHWRSVVQHRSWIFKSGSIRYWSQIKPLDGWPLGGRKMA